MRRSYTFATPNSTTVLATESIRLSAMTDASVLSAGARERTRMGRQSVVAPDESRSRHVARDGPRGILTYVREMRHAALSASLRIPRRRRRAPRAALRPPSQRPVIHLRDRSCTSSDPATGRICPQRSDPDACPAPHVLRECFGGGCQRLVRARLVLQSLSCSQARARLPSGERASIAMIAHAFLPLGVWSSPAGP